MVFATLILIVIKFVHNVTENFNYDRLLNVINEIEEIDKEEEFNRGYNNLRKKSYMKRLKKHVENDRLARQEARRKAEEEARKKAEEEEARRKAEEEARRKAEEGKKKKGGR